MTFCFHTDRTWLTAQKMIFRTIWTNDDLALKNRPVHQDFRQQIGQAIKGWLTFI